MKAKCLLFLDCVFLQYSARLFVMKKSQVTVKIDRTEACHHCYPSTHRKCAERRLLDACLREASKACVPPQKLKAWIHRKTGGVMSILRFRMDGSLGCCVPCHACRRELLKYDLTIQCVTPEGTVFTGKLNDEYAPPSRFTSGQLRNMKKSKQN